MGGFRSGDTTSAAKLVVTKWTFFFFAVVVTGATTSLPPPHIQASHQALSFRNLKLCFSLHDDDDTLQRSMDKKR